VSHKLFIVADKFHDNISTNAIQENNISYLSAIDKEKEDLLDHWMNLLDEKMMYGTLHGTYKRALQKALQTKSRSLRLIEILEEFANEDSEFEDEGSNEDKGLDEESQDSGGSDKENIELQNPKIRRRKGRPVGTKRYKSFHEKEGKKQSNKSVARNVVVWVIIRKIVILTE